MQVLEKKSRPVKKILTMGNIACAEGAIAAGCRFYAGYPITPSSEIAAHMAKRLPMVDGVFIQMEDEIASIVACIGASYAGAKVMTATSGPGFSLMAENIGLAVMMEAPVVIATVMRGGPSTGQPTKPSQSDVMQIRYASHGDYEIIAVAPATVQEAYDLTIKAFNFAEKYRTPVIVALDGILGQMLEPVEFHQNFEIVNRKKPQVPPDEYAPFKVIDDDLVPPMATAGTDYSFYVTGLTHDEYGNPRMDPEDSERLVRRLNEKILRARKEINDWKEYYTEDAELVFVSYGINMRGVLEAVQKARSKGLKVGLVQLRTLWPFPDEVMEMQGERGVKKVVVSEMNYGKMVREVERFRHLFEVDSLMAARSKPITPQEVYEKIKKEVKG